MPRRNRKMKGGDGEEGWWGSISTAAADAWDKTKNATSSLTGSQPAPYMAPPAPPPYIPPQGGKRRRGSRKNKRGGYSANMSTNNLASSAASFSGKTAQPLNIVGGRTKRRRVRNGKTRRHRRR